MTKTIKDWAPNNFEQRVELKAYEIYVNRGHVHGQDWADWFEAEKLVEAEISTVDKDCIRSESFYKTSHQSRVFPADIAEQNVDKSVFQ